MGQFLDDVVFTFVFGFFKYLVYALMLLMAIILLVGIKVWMNKKFLAISLTLILVTCFMISSVLLIVDHYYVLEGTLPVISGNMFVIVLDHFIQAWYHHSIFYEKIVTFFTFNGEWFNVHQAGGIFGEFLAAIFAYTSIYGPVVWACIAYLLVFSWMLTGSPLWCFGIKSAQQTKLKIMFSDGDQRYVRSFSKAKRKQTKPEAFWSRQVMYQQKPHQSLDNNYQSDHQTSIVHDLLYQNDEQKNQKPDYQQTAFQSHESNDAKPFNFSQKAQSNLDSHLQPNMAFGQQNIPTNIAQVQSTSQHQPSSFDIHQQEPVANQEPVILEKTNSKASHAKSFKTKNQNLYLNPETSDNSTTKIQKLLKASVSEASYQSFEEANYLLPPLELLHKIDQQKEILAKNQDQAVHNANKLNECFVLFNLAAEVACFNVGSTVTKFEINLATGVKVNKFMAIESDLKLALGTSQIRFQYPIPGKSAIGLELPNNHKTIVRLKSLLTNDVQWETGLKAGIGKTVEGANVYLSLDEAPHLLIAGSTGSGKSVCINSIITCMLLHYKPSELRFLLIDPKQVELNIYTDLPHLLCPVIYKAEQAIQALKVVIQEMEKRYSLLAQKKVRNITEYNQQTPSSERLQYWVVVIDELADIMYAKGKVLEGLIQNITQMARASGIHLIVATQRPSTDIVTGVIKANIPSRIAFFVPNAVDSRVILNSSGAEKLLGKGDMLYQPMGVANPVRVQGVYVSINELNRVLNYVKTEHETHFHPAFKHIF